MPYEFLTGILFQLISNGFNLRARPLPLRAHWRRSDRCDEANICQSSESLVNGLLGEGSTTSKKYRTIDRVHASVDSAEETLDALLSPPPLTASDRITFWNYRLNFGLITGSHAENYAA